MHFVIFVLELSYDGQIIYYLMNEIAIFNDKSIINTQIYILISYRSWMVNFMQRILLFAEVAENVIYDEISPKWKLSMVFFLNNFMIYTCVAQRIWMILLEIRRNIGNIKIYFESSKRALDTQYENVYKI